jgi:hypothetical protein
VEPISVRVADNVPVVSASEQLSVTEFLSLDGALMSQSNPFSPPRSHVADLADPLDMDIDSLQVSDT